MTTLKAQTLRSHTRLQVLEALKKIAPSLTPIFIESEIKDGKNIPTGCFLYLVASPFELIEIAFCEIRDSRDGAFVESYITVSSDARSKKLFLNEITESNFDNAVEQIALYLAAVLTPKEELYDTGLSKALIKDHIYCPAPSELIEFVEPDFSPRFSYAKSLWLVSDDLGMRLKAVGQPVFALSERCIWGKLTDEAHEEDQAIINALGLKHIVDSSIFLADDIFERLAPLDLFDVAIKIYQDDKLVLDLPLFELALTVDFYAPCFVEIEKNLQASTQDFEFSSTYKGFPARFVVDCSKLR